MNIYEDFRNEELTEKLADKIQSYKGPDLKIMEVCGSHTDAIGKYGIRDILPKNVTLVSGPGCPVCVTDKKYMDTAIELCKRENVIICSFGDLIKVKGTGEKLVLGENVRVVLSPFECIKTAMDNPDREVVFLSVGFETTTPITALTIKKAYENNIKNLSFFVSNKTMPGILHFLMDMKTDVNAFLFPGHVATIEGCEFYRNFCYEYNIKGTVCGFEPADILASVAFIMYGEEKFKNLYTRFVKEKGNQMSKAAVNEVFEMCDTYLREIGTVKNAGLKIRNKYADFDVCHKFGIDYSPIDQPKEKHCLCGEILLGRKTPKDCPLFGKACRPNDAVGPCMVSEEGTCATYYKYKI